MMKTIKSFLSKGCSLRYLFVIGIILCFLFPIVLFKVCGYQFVFNTTSSLKGYVFVMKPFDKGKNKFVSKGDIIVFVHALYPQQQILKKVTHLGGETYSVDVCSLLEDSKQPLNQAKVVPLNYIAVKGDHSRSFDSRYETFGFIPLKNIKGRAWRLC